MLLKVKFHRIGIMQDNVLMNIYFKWKLKNKSNDIYNIIKFIHSYECFEFAIYDISSINKEYLKWIDKKVM